MVYSRPVPVAIVILVDLGLIFPSISLFPHPMSLAQMLQDPPYVVP
jgi:hypothetical protein